MGPKACERAAPRPGPDQILLKVRACGICRTHLWGERSIKSITNLTRRNGEEFLRIAPRVPVLTHVAAFDLAQANVALERFKNSRIQGTAVLTP